VNAYKGKNRALDCDYVRYLVSIDKVPDLLLDGDTFIIVDSPCVIIRVSAAEVLQVCRDKEAAPCTIFLTTRREMCICILLLTACCGTLGWWWCRVFKFDNSLAYDWSEMNEMNGVYLTALESLFPPLMGLDNAALRSSCSSSSSSSKNSCEGSASRWRWFDSWFGILVFEEITRALEELVVRLPVTTVVDEAVRANDLAPALAT
jgi:hypothetical protein